MAISPVDIVVHPVDIASIQILEFNSMSDVHES